MTLEYSIRNDKGKLSPHFSWIPLESRTPSGTQVQKSKVLVSEKENDGLVKEEIKTVTVMVERSVVRGVRSGLLRS